MNANGIFQTLTEKFGSYEDSGVIHSNGREIRDICWEIEQEYLYPQMQNKETLYIVHH